MVSTLVARRESDMRESIHDFFSLQGTQSEHNRSQ